MISLSLHTAKTDCEHLGHGYSLPVFIPMNFFLIEGKLAQNAYVCFICISIMLHIRLFEFVLRMAFSTYTEIEKQN